MSKDERTGDGGWMADGMNGHMDGWGLDGWREICYILASIHGRAHQRRGDIYSAAHCPAHRKTDSVGGDGGKRSLF